jgi:glyoxylase-like metal-dependent hydrolase (beta-lactamase superfamily II)
MSEQKRFSYVPERIADDLYAIPLPLNDGSPVNAYIAIGDDGLWLIDGGLGSERCQATLRSGIEALGHTFEEVRGLLVTHGHTDHVGAADAVLANRGVMLAHRLEAIQSRNLAFDEVWLQRNGLPSDETNRVDRSRPFVWPEPTRLLEDGEHVRWGNLDLHVVWCPGHTPGLVCLYAPDRKLLFTTDHVMRRAPAPVSVRNPAHDDPLRDYLSSVGKLKALAVQTVLPGHGRPFHHLSQRLQSIETNIQHQLDAIVERLYSGPCTAYDLLTLSALRDRRPIATRYEVSLVLARLRYLERLGRLHRIETEGSIRYALAA